MMRRNSSWSISPSPSRSASSIISLQLLLAHHLPNLLRHPPQILQADLPRLIVVKQSKRLEYLLFAVSLAHLLRHHVEELGEVDLARAVAVDVADHLLQLLLLGLEAQRAHGHLQLLRVDLLTAVRVEQIKRLDRGKGEEWGEEGEREGERERDRRERVWGVSTGEKMRGRWAAGVGVRATSLISCFCSSVSSILAPRAGPLAEVVFLYEDMARV